MSILADFSAPLPQTSGGPRQCFGSGGPFENLVGYSRAVRAGPWVQVAGTAALLPDGTVVGVGDQRAQTLFILHAIESTLKTAGARLEDVVRTRMFVTNIDHWEAVGRAHGDFFGQIRPVTSMVEVSRLIRPEFLVEIEADAIIVDAH